MYFSKNSESHNMRRVLYLLSIFTLLSAFTCEDEPLDQGILDNVDPNNPDNLACVGQWELVSLNYEGTSTTTAAGTTTTSSYTGTSLNEDYILILEDDGTYTAQGSYDIELNTVVPNFPPIVTTSSITANSSGTYTATATTITTSGALVDVALDGVPQSNEDVEGTSDYVVSNIGNTIVFTNEVQDTIEQGGVTAEVYVSSTSVFNGIGTGGGTGGGNPSDDCTDGDIEDQTAQGNFKGTNFTVQGGTYRSQFGAFFCRIYVSELTGGDCSFPEFGGNEGVIIFNLDNLDPQTIEFSDVAGEGESLNFNSIVQGTTEVELAKCGRMEILSSTATTVSGRLIAEGQDGSTINGNITLTVCE